VNLAPLTYPDALWVAERMREWDAREVYAGRWTDDPADVARDVASCRMGWSVSADGAPAAVLGARPIHPGVWSVWMFATPAWPRVSLSVTRFVKRVMIPALRATGAHRAQCASIEGHEEAHRWLEFLGAVRESTLHRFGRNGEDFHLYRWDR
jgi:hypothetical protein